MDWFYSQGDFGLVLEDDLQISPDFVDFVRYCRENLESSENLWMISGDQFFPENLGSSHLSMCNYPLVWGWATWSSKWYEMRAAIDAQRSFHFRYLLSPIYSFWWTGAKRVELGLVDTWDIPLAFEMRRRGKLTITPPVNLVRNLGFDQFASHTKRNLFPLDLPVSRMQSNLSEVSLIDGRLSVFRLNRKLEKRVFKIGSKHLLSPLKLYLQEKFIQMKS